MMTAFHISVAEVNQDKAMIETKRQMVCTFVVFGVNAGLLSPDEGNDWMDVAWDRKTLMEVSEKWEVGE